ncbi:hypothetical protein [Pantoea sp. A4]|uniref:hypothetical protein n=1 Tax=Pantoea sp. A4 TaxID=1225184 RepID=UPI000B242712|nr:hypothetical protein [Pantoea sp. A4]
MPFQLGPFFPAVSTARPSPERLSTKRPPPKPPTPVKLQELSDPTPTSSPFRYRYCDALLNPTLPPPRSDNRTQLQEVTFVMLEEAQSKKMQANRARLQHADSLTPEYLKTLNATMVDALQRKTRMLNSDYDYATHRLESFTARAVWKTPDYVTAWLHEVLTEDEEWNPDTEVLVKIEQEDPDLPHSMYPYSLQDIFTPGFATWVKHNVACTTHFTPGEISVQWPEDTPSILINTQEKGIPVAYRALNENLKNLSPETRQEIIHEIFETLADNVDLLKNQLLNIGKFDLNRVSVLSAKTWIDKKITDTGMKYNTTLDPEEMISGILKKRVISTGLLNPAKPTHIYRRENLRHILGQNMAEGALIENTLTQTITCEKIFWPPQLKKQPKLIDELTNINFGRAYADDVATIKKDQKQLAFYTDVQKISVLQTVVSCLKFENGITKQDFSAINAFLSGASNAHVVNIAAPGDSGGIKLTDIIAIPIKETDHEITALFFSLKDKQNPLLKITINKLRYNISGMQKKWILNHLSLYYEKLPVLYYTEKAATTFTGSAPSSRQKNRLQLSSQGFTLGSLSSELLNRRFEHTQHNIDTLMRSYDERIVSLLTKLGRELAGMAAVPLLVLGVVGAPHVIVAGLIITLTTIVAPQMLKFITADTNVKREKALDEIAIALLMESVGYAAGKLAAKFFRSANNAFEAIKNNPAHLSSPVKLLQNSVKSSLNVPRRLLDRSMLSLEKIDTSEFMDEIILKIIRFLRRLKLDKATHSGRESPLENLRHLEDWSDFDLQKAFFSPSSPLIPKIKVQPPSRDTSLASSINENILSPSATHIDLNSPVYSVAPALRKLSQQLILFHTSDTLKISSFAARASEIGYSAGLKPVLEKIIRQLITAGLRNSARGKEAPEKNQLRLLTTAVSPDVILPK